MQAQLNTCGHDPIVSQLSNINRNSSL
jgi:hypothetical protein